MAWLSVRSQGGVFVWRVEDLDGPRVVPGRAEEQARDLSWLGLDWDEGPAVAAIEGNPAGGAFAPYEQSRRDAYYLEALARLNHDRRLFPCTLTRRELRGIASAPHGPEAQAYPRSLRPQSLRERWLEELLAGDDPAASVRFRVDDRKVVYDDLFLGPQEERVDQAVGDFVLRRRDGLWAYQLAVVVDDIEMQITEVVRGQDLVSSTARQVQLFEALGARPPRFGHVPLLLSEEGEKLSKRDASLTLDSLRAAGVRASSVVGFLAYGLGLRDEPLPVRLGELIESFSWQRLRERAREERIPGNLAERLAAGSSGFRPD